jgi:cold shock CspA family protein
MSDTTNTTSSGSSGSSRFTGIVKWFNDKEGYGFITICDEGLHKDKDIFVHYKSIRVTNSQYVYLIQGEYVNFTLLNIKSDTHEYQASDVSGVQNGPIMCESKNTARQVVIKKYHNDDQDRQKYTNNCEDRNKQENGFVRVESKRNKNKPK